MLAPIHEPSEIPSSHNYAWDSTPLRKSCPCTSFMARVEMWLHCTHVTDDWYANINNFFQLQLTKIVCQKVLIMFFFLFFFLRVQQQNRPHKITSECFIHYCCNLTSRDLHQTQQQKKTKTMKFNEMRK